MRCPRRPLGPTPVRVGQPGRLLLAALMAVTIGPIQEASGQEPRTNGELARLLLEELLAPVAESAETAPGTPGIALRPDRDANRGPSLQALYEDIGNFFYDRGYEVWTLGARDSIPPEALILDFEVEVASIDYPRRAGSLLGFGAGETLRRGVLGITGRLRDNRRGLWLWRGSPRRQVEEWIPTRRVQELAGDAPQWVDAAPAAQFEPDAGWWERALVSGLLGGIVMLYFSGAN